MKTQNATEWVVLGSWTEDGEVRCEIMVDGLASEQEANDACCDLACGLGDYFANEQGGSVEVCTREEAEQVIS